MESFKIHMFIVGVFLCISYVVSEPNVISFGDFMEFDVGLHTACENSTERENITQSIISSFTECSFKISNSEPKDLFGNYENICQNIGKYLDCWDKMKAEALKRCGNDKEPILPAVYRATVTAFCGNDNGAKKIADLKQAFEESKGKTCPEESGTHWVESCSPLLTAMHSPDICARHQAISKCVEKITCDSVKLAQMFRQVYLDGRPHLQCNERRV